MNASLPLQRAALAATLVAIAFVIPQAPAQAAYCGQNDDVTAILKLTVATYPKIAHTNEALNQKYVRIVDVNGTYAYSVVNRNASKIPFYWEKPTGTWHLAAANHAPKSWDKVILNFFESDAEPSSGRITGPCAR